MKLAAPSFAIGAIIALASWSEAATKPTHLCYFETALVPCARLHSRADNMWGSQITFRPTKSIPLWPNFIIIGGREKAKDFDASNDNRAIPYDAAKENIETRALTRPPFDETFVDQQIARISVWRGSEHRNLLGLTDTRNVYHGDEVFELWKQAVGDRFTCATKHGLDMPELPLEKHCVFTRVTAHGARNEIEYCDFQVDRTSDVREETVCTIVASEALGVRRVLSARYADWYFEGGASAGEYTCTLAAIADDKIAPIIETFVRPYIGQSSKYFSKLDDGVHYYKAEGINIFDPKEDMFLRAYISGSYYSVTDKQRTSFSRFTMNATFTVSAQASDNIIDYREPNEAAADRMRNRFNAALRSYVLTISKKASCRLD